MCVSERGDSAVCFVFNNCTDICIQECFIFFQELLEQIYIHSCVEVCPEHHTDEQGFDLPNSLVLHY